MDRMVVSISSSNSLLSCSYKESRGNWIRLGKRAEGKDTGNLQLSSITFGLYPSKDQSFSHLPTHMALSLIFYERIEIR